MKNLIAIISNIGLLLLIGAVTLIMIPWGNYVFTGEIWVLFDDPTRHIAAVGGAVLLSLALMAVAGLEK